MALFGARSGRSGRFGNCVELLQTGDGSGARDRFAEIWSRMQPIRDPFQGCVLSHSMADLQDEIDDEIDMELMWDTRALNAALRAHPEDVVLRSQNHRFSK
jgi:hypothetical protein